MVRFILTVRNTSDMIDKIPVEPYKQHQGFGDQIGYKGIGLGKAEQAAIEKINEIIEYLDKKACCEEIIEAKDADLEN